MEQRRLPQLKMLGKTQDDSIESSRGYNSRLFGQDLRDTMKAARQMLVECELEALNTVGRVPVSTMGHNKPHGNLVPGTRQASDSH